MRAAMASLILKSSVGESRLTPDLRRALADEYRIVAPVYQFAGKTWLRISAQIYNEPQDYRRCAEACLALRRGRFGELFN